MVVKLLAINSVGLLANGLREKFNFGKMFFALIISHLKDSKTSVVNNVQNTLKKLLYSINIDDVVEEISEGLADKNGGYRA
jgi:hypothetical protein